VKLCPYCGLFIKEADSQCIHCGRKQLQPPAEPAAMDHLPELIEEEDSRYRQNVRYLIELAFLVALLLALNVVYGPSGIPAGVTSTAVKDLIGVDSGEEYAQWVEEYRLHIAKRNRKILNDMRTLDHDKFTTPYIKRFKKEYLEYIFTTGKYRYSPYTPQQRVVAENPAQFVEVQVQKFEVGRRFIDPVDVSVFNSSPFPLFDIGINLVYEATKGPNRGRKIRGFLLIREPVSPGKLKIYMNLHHLQPVPSFEGVDKVSFYVTGVKVGKSGE